MPAWLGFRSTGSVKGSILRDEPIAPVDFDLLPFSPSEAEAIKAELRSLANDSPKNVERVVQAGLQEIREAALLCASRRAHGHDTSRSRLGQKLRRLASSRKPSVPSKIDWEVLIGLTFGAARLGLIEYYPVTFDETIFRQALGKLTDDQLRQCAKRAMVEPMLPGIGDVKPLLLGDTGGRPAASIVDDYVEQLGATYTKLCGRRFVFSRDYMNQGAPVGPLIRFLRRCLLPSVIGVQLQDEAIISAILRVRKDTDRRSL